MWVSCGGGSSVCRFVVCSPPPWVWSPPAPPQLRRAGEKTLCEITLLVEAKDVSPSDQPAEGFAGSGLSGVFFLRKQPRLFCFAQGPLAVVFFCFAGSGLSGGCFSGANSQESFALLKDPLAVVFFCANSQECFAVATGARGVWKCGARQSHGKAQKKRPPEGPSQSKAQKKNTRKPSPNSQSPLPVVLCA